MLKTLFVLLKKYFVNLMTLVGMAVLLVWCVASVFHSMGIIGGWIFGDGLIFISDIDGMGVGAKQSEVAFFILSLVFWSGVGIAKVAKDFRNLRV